MLFRNSWGPSQSEADSETWLQTIISFVVVSVAQVAPYYLAAYDFFVFTAAADEQYCGFVNSFYCLVNQLIAFLPALLLEHLSSINLNMLILVCIAVLAVTLVHSVLFQCLVFEKQFAIAEASTGSTSNNNIDNTTDIRPAGSLPLLASPTASAAALQQK
eukprot:GEZU01019554.1.p1 GENE.GEZU01019554.1~~GEZU01019554.1.p1  ORF type:complete len:160 (-),score=31.41 GEZU01019554.1:73-552(-)